MRIKGFTLVELMVVIAIIAILATVTIPNFTDRRERIFNREAAATLKQLQAAEKSYNIELSSYYASTGASASEHVTNIEINLKVDLLSGSGRAWNYTSYNTGCVQATRNGGDSRNWYLCIDGDTVASGTCAVNCT